MNSPTFLALFSAVFILLGCYNIYSGFKRIRESRARGIYLSWFKQINILTGIEYILLALVFIISTAVRNKSIPAALNEIVVPLYIILLLAAAILAGLVIRQGISNARQLRRSQAEARSKSETGAVVSSKTSRTVAETDDELTPEERAERLRQRRERRQKAAAARRRRAGKA